jgi:PAS domain S-box-containing protein
VNVDAEQLSAMLEQLGFGRLFFAIQDAAIVAEIESESIVLWNWAACRMFGYSVDEALDMPLETIVPEHLRRAHKAGLERYRTTRRSALVGSGDPVELRARRKDGGEIDVELLLSPISDVGIPGLFVLALVRDITARRDAERALRQQTDLYETLLRTAAELGEGVAIADAARHRLLWVNEAMCDMFRYGRDELLQLPSALALIAPEEVDAMRARARSRVSGEADHERYETVGLRKDGSRFELEVAAKSLGDTRSMAVFRDISERKRLESFKDDFIANAAHELRTPVASLLGFSQLLDARDRMPEERVEAAIAAIQRQARRLSTLLQNMLDLSRMQKGRLRVELAPLSAADAVRHALDGSPPPAQATATVSVPQDVTVVADPDRLDQILTNLLTNAYNYGGANVEVASAVRDGRVVLSVCDDGPGVPEELAARLFEPFSRGDNTAGVSGSGLGLAIVKMLAEAMGGDVWYEPRRPRGACFSLRLNAA